VDPETDIIDIRADAPNGSGSSVVPLSLVVPLYNEEVRLEESGRQLVDFVASYPAGSELILADDGSSDTTVEVAEKLARHSALTIRLLELGHAGKGAALRAGIAAARGPIVAFCDVDLATPLDELRRIVSAAASAPVLAIGSRDVVSTRLVRREGEVREFLGKAYNRVLRATLTPGINDTQCGAKAAHRAVWCEVLPYCRENGFAWDVEAIAIGRRRGVAVWEVGIEWNHDERTRVRPMRDGLDMLRSVPRIVGRVRQVPSLVVGPEARPITLEPSSAPLVASPCGRRA
jgi:glycosyltransferase involved in cell wall biosynthesis